MFKLSELVRISHYAGERADYAQGGGGNASVKLDFSTMVIKARGVRLSDVTETSGFSAVDYPRLRAFYGQVGGREGEEANTSMIAECTKPFGDLEALAPSAETGFHSILKNYVLHTHSVYANLLCCSAEGERLAEEIFGGADFGCLYLRAARPGFELTLRIKEGIETFERKHGKTPLVIFLRNHGLVVHADSCIQVIELHQRINEQLMKYFGIAIGEFAPSDLVELSDGVFESHTPGIAERIAGENFGFDALEALPLFPDQVIFLNNTFRTRPETFRTGAKLVYYADERTAENLDANVQAWLFLKRKMRELGLQPVPMTRAEIEFLKQWRER